MARPKHPLIDRREVVEKALEIIDRDGLEAISIRKIGNALGVDGTSLYHHFADKQAILDGVRLLVVQKSHVGEPATDSESWHEYLRRMTSGYRKSLLRHPNAAPLLAPTQLIRPFSLVFRDQVAAKLVDDGVPVRFVIPIIDSVETLAYGSALLNPTQQSAKARIATVPKDNVDSLARAVRASPRSPSTMFDLQLDALIEGWTVVIRHE